MRPAYCEFCGAALIVVGAGVCGDNPEQQYNRRDWPARVDHVCDPRDVKLMDRINAFAYLAVSERSR